MSSSDETVDLWHGNMCEDKPLFSPQIDISSVNDVTVLIVPIHAVGDDVTKIRAEVPVNNTFASLDQAAVSQDNFKDTIRWHYQSIGRSLTLGCDQYFNRVEVAVAVYGHN